MKAPLPRGSAIDARRYKRWIDRFGSYRTGIINVTIESWLNQFETGDRDLAARVLDAIDFYGLAQIHAAFRQALGSFSGWHEDEKKRRGKWRFAPMSGSAGESGDAMLYHFRIANGLDSKKHKSLFLSRSDLFRQPQLKEDDPNKLGQDDVVVLLDDFSGSGKQVCDAWNDPETSFGALLAGVGKVYLILVAAGPGARDKISDETPLSLMPAHSLLDSDNVFSQSCKHFSNSDRVKLMKYGLKANKKNPQGFEKCGMLVVFQHRAPNNTLPILHMDHDRWMGLFPRHD